MARESCKLAELFTCPSRQNGPGISQVRVKEARSHFANVTQASPESPSKCVSYVEPRNEREREGCRISHPVIFKKTQAF